MIQYTKNVYFYNLNKDTIKCSFDATYFFSEYLKQPSTFYDLFIIYYNRIIYLKRITIKLSFYDLTKKVKYNNCVYPTFNLQDLTYMSIEVMVSQTTFILPVPCIEFNCWIIFGSQAIIGVVIQCLQKKFAKIISGCWKKLHKFAKVMATTVCANIFKRFPYSSDPSQSTTVTFNEKHTW